LAIVRFDIAMLPLATKNALSPAPPLAAAMSIVAPLPLITRPEVFESVRPITIWADGWIVPLVRKLIVNGPEPAQALAVWIAVARSPTVVTLYDWAEAGRIQLQTMQSQIATEAIHVRSESRIQHL
jgi:hypothetical protein